MKLLLVDDHLLFLQAMRNLLAAHDIEVAGTAGDGLEALDKARALHPDVILMDIQMPRCDGLTAARLIKSELPDVHIVMLTVSDDDANLFEAIRCGASGYLLKSLDAQEFLNLLSALERGEPSFAPGLTHKILDEFSRQPARPAAPGAAEAAAPQFGNLTDRQIEILTLIAQGLTYKDIGAALCLSERTIKYHMGEILRQLHLKSRAQVIAYAGRQGLTCS